MDWLSDFIPNGHITRSGRIGLAIGWGLGAFILWQFSSIQFLPKPTEILGSFEILRQQGVFLEFGSSIWTMTEAILWTMMVSLTLAYLSVVPAMKPFVTFIAGLRYLGLVGLMLAFTLIAPSGHILKVMVLSFGMTVFYLRDMLHVVGNVPQERYDHARTLGMGPWRSVYEVVVLGTLADAIESLRVNAAMGWMMLTMVEGVVRSEGGIGVVLINMNRHMDLSAVGAILISLFCLGLAQDFMLGFIKDYLVCPYARIK